MKKLLFLIFPLAFFVGFMPYFFSEEEVKTTSVAPQIVEEQESLNESENSFSGLKEHVSYDVELLSSKCGIIENATILTNSGIENI